MTERSADRCIRQETGWLVGGPLLRFATIRCTTDTTTDTFLFISHTTNVLLFKFLCNAIIGVRIIKEMPGSVASGTPSVYRVSQEECTRLREGVPYVKVYRYNPKNLCPKLNGYRDNGQRKVWSSGGFTHCTCQLTSLIDVYP